MSNIAVYNGNGLNVPITLQASIAAVESPELIKKFASAIRASSAQGYQLLLIPEYFNQAKSQINNINDVRLLAAKLTWGEKILRDISYTEEMAKLAIRQCVGGVASFDNQGNQIIRALIPAQIVNEVFQSIPDEIIVAAVAELSNDNTLIQLLINQREF